MVLKRSKYGLNTGNSLVSAGTDRAKAMRNHYSGTTNGSTARVVKRIVIPTEGSASGQESKLTMEQKRQLIEQIEQQLTEQVDGGMQAAIVTTGNRQVDEEDNDENQENRVASPHMNRIHKKVPYGSCVSAAMEQPNINRQSSTAHNCDVIYSGNKKKRWEMMDEVKQALKTNNIDLDSFRGRIIAYTNIPTTTSATDNKPRVGVSTVIDTFTNAEKVRRVGKHDVVIAAAKETESNKLSTDNSGGEGGVAERKQQGKKSRRHAKQKCSANNNNIAAPKGSKKSSPSTVSGIQLVYDFVEPLPVNNSFEQGKRSYYEGRCYHKECGRNQKAINAVKLHMAEERLVLTPAAAAACGVHKSVPIIMTESTEKSQVEFGGESPPVEDNPIWGFISAALKKEARSNKSELNRGGWIVLDIIQEQEDANEHDVRIKSGSDDTENGGSDGDEAEYDGFEDDDNISVSTNKSDTFEKPNIGQLAAETAEPEEVEDGFVLFEVKKIQQIS